MKSYIINNKVYIVGGAIDALSISGNSRYPVIIVNDESQIPTVDLIKHKPRTSSRTPRPPRR